MEKSFSAERRISPFSQSSFPRRIGQERYSRSEKEQRLSASPSRARALTSAIAGSMTTSRSASRAISPSEMTAVSCEVRGRPSRPVANSTLTRAKRLSVASPTKTASADCGIMETFFASSPLLRREANSRTGMGSRATEAISSSTSSRGASSRKVRSAPAKPARSSSVTRAASTSSIKERTLREKPAPSALGGKSARMARIRSAHAHSVSRS